MDSWTRQRAGTNDLPGPFHPWQATPLQLVKITYFHRLSSLFQLCHEIQEIQKRNSQREAQQLLQLHDTEGQQEDTVKEANQAEQNVKKFLKIWEQLKSGEQWREKKELLTNGCIK